VGVSDHLMQFCCPQYPERPKLIKKEVIEESQSKNAPLRAFENKREGVTYGS